MPSSSEFISEKLLSGALSIAFASSLSQVEVFSGECGLNPSPFHLLLVLALFGGLAVSLCVLVSAEIVFRSHVSLGAAAVCYVVTTGFLFGTEFLLADRLLVEVICLFFFAKKNPAPFRLFIARLLFSCAVGKMLNCRSSWLSFAALKTDALNQPFPFTPVWHLAQLPESIASVLAIIILTAEVVIPVQLVFSEAVGPLFGALGLCLYYALIGNFNWTITVLLAAIVRVLPGSILTLVLSGTTLKRWGWKSTETFSERDAETAFLKALAEATVTAVLVASAVASILFGFNGSLAAPGVSEYLQTALAVIGWAMVCVSSWRLRTNPRVLFVVFAGLWFCASPFLSVISFNQIPNQEDFSGLPTCFTFQPGVLGPAAHTSSGRAGFLLQTRYSQVGTNTVGSNLGGSKYAELAVPGSVHGDEVRPPFLLGHLPRLALKLWRIGTGRPADVQEGLVLLRQLEQAVETGSNSLRILFNDDVVTAALVGKKNQVQAFYQLYQVTHRAADHLWWKRNYDQVAALPTKELGTIPGLAQECSWIVPPKVFGVTTDLVLTTMVLAAVAGRLLFTSDRPRKGKK